MMILMEKHHDLGSKQGQVNQLLVQLLGTQHLCLAVLSGAASGSAPGHLKHLKTSYAML